MLGSQPPYNLFAAIEAQDMVTLKEDGILVTNLFGTLVALDDDNRLLLNVDFFRHVSLNIN